MHFAGTAAVAAAVGASLVTAVPMSLRRQDTGLSACANITEQYQQAVANNATRFFADGQVAYDCLNSMPFDAEKGALFVQELKKYFQFQSTIPVLANPPDSYLSPALDLLGGMDSIYENATSGQYKSQFELDSAINNLMNSANDGHLFGTFCSLGVFQFSQAAELVSVSANGTSLPKLYVGQDVRLAANGSTEVSDVVQINGQNATEYLTALGLTQPNQDPDAQWNGIFSNQARGPAGGNGGGAFASNNGLWPGVNSFELTFSNGSTSTAPVYASVRRGLNFNFTSGQDLYEVVCLPSEDNSPSPTTGNSVANQAEPEPSYLATPTVGPLGYPTPIAREAYNLLAGYYLDDEQFNDTAVLFVPSFSTSQNGFPGGVRAEFADVANTFVAQAVADGKTKMIIDVSANPGGDILAGFNLFKLFFPDLEPYSATRMRDHEAEMLHIKALSTYAIEDETSLINTGPFWWAAQVTPDQQSDFGSWEEFYGPDNIQGANMTSLYANFNFSTRSTPDDPVQGYGGIPTNFTSRPFASENILIVSDGFCQSTCTTFVTLMTQPEYGNVKTVAFGGRAIEEPMQIMGGVRGAQSAEWDYLFELNDQAYQYAVNQTELGNATLDSGELARFNETRPLNLTAFPLVVGGGSLNLRNAYAPDDDETPLQFAYQAADCKLFYTFDNLIQPATTWSDAANAIWGNGACVPGSEPSS